MFLMSAPPLAASVLASFNNIRVESDERRVGTFDLKREAADKGSFVVIEHCDIF